MCNPMQARIQSQISRYSAAITELLADVKDLKRFKKEPLLGSYYISRKAELRELETVQKILKDVISNTYWGGY